MKWWQVIVLVLAVGLAAACGTRANPKSCADGLCTDQRYPFCDVDGTLGGEPNECIAVACTAGEFESCRGDQEIRCSATGNDYDLVQCELGCDPQSDGCRLCEANETRCTNGTVARCDANGNVASTEACALGCFQDEPRCRDIDPSNGLATYLDTIASQVDLEFENAHILTESGEVLDNAGVTIGTTSFLHEAVGRPAIRVFIGHNIRLKDVSVFANRFDRSIGGFLRSGPAVAFLATGTIEIEGRVRLYGGAGGIVGMGCSGADGYYEFDQGKGRYTGSGGGAHATAGAKGGDIDIYASGGAGGNIAGTESLVPLRGGCSSGNSQGGGASPGGGAIQLSSRTAIIVRGIIDARGTTQLAVVGGGAGGGVLIEAPKVTLEPAARIITTGGAGGSGPADSHDLTPPSDDGIPQPGVRCVPATAYCTAGGNGAAPGVPATPGVNAAFNTNVEGIGAGGGGGGLGRIRINTPDRTYTKASSAIEAGVLSTGVLATR